MNSLTLKSILEELDSRLSDSIDKLEQITPDLEKDSDAFLADDARELAEDIRALIYKEEVWDECTMLRLLKKEM